MAKKIAIAKGRSRVVVHPPKKRRDRYPFVGCIELPGLPRIHVENRKGTMRRGVDPDGHPWETCMPAHYGEFTGTRGADGDPIDVFVGENAHAAHVYVASVADVETGKYDECKVFVGFNRLADVAAAFGKAYDRRGMRHGRFRKLTVLEFCGWLDQYKKDARRIDVGAEMHKSLAWETLSETVKSMEAQC